MATISAVLYVNIIHPQLKVEVPNWADRCKEILKKWHATSMGEKAKYWADRCKEILKKWNATSMEEKAKHLRQSRENRSTLRAKR